MKWYLRVLKKYAVFSGRARRTEFWMFNLFAYIFFIALLFLDDYLGTVMEDLFNASSWADVGYGLISNLYILAIFIPSLAVCVRRLHDLDISGWFLLIGLIPFLGEIILIVAFCSKGKEGMNRYGANPKEKAQLIEIQST